MGLSDAGLRHRPTKLIYPDHRPTPRLTEVVAPRMLQPIVRVFADHKRSDITSAASADRAYDKQMQQLEVRRQS